ncbi:hypothetical protein AYO41_00210 [Verrucomicrobia bacterium SCGC AG-212-E04]|nr:hypothetical protein AYO41_00210 [Verrucomicrobia bacterium SCGC AG-212-E04]
MARRFPFFLSLMLLAGVALAQTPTPSPAPSPSPAKKPVATTPAAERRGLVDGLSANDLQEAMKLLRQNYIDPAALTDQPLARAQLEGLLARLGPGAKLVANSGLATPAAAEVASPFRSEVLDGPIGYLRVGALNRENLGLLDAAVKSFVTKKIVSVIVDLRATPASSDYELAAQLINRFVPKGRPLFTLRKPGTKEERLFTSNADPIFNGYLVIVVDRETAGAAEVVAAVTRLYARSMVVGQASAGQAVEYGDFALGANYLLRIAVAEVLPAANVKIFPDGVKPDLPVEGAPAGAERDRVLKAALESGGVAAVIYDTERMHINEAALVAGINPEIEAMQDAQRRRKNPVEILPRDIVLQRAVDLIVALNTMGPKN